MLFLIYCDTNTLIDCNSEQFNAIIEKHTPFSIQINKNLWIANIEKTDYSSFLAKEEDFFYDFIEPVSDEDSILAILKFDPKDGIYQFPESVLHFLDEFGNSNSL